MSKLMVVEARAYQRCIERMRIAVIVAAIVQWWAWTQLDDAALWAAHVLTALPGNVALAVWATMPRFSHAAERWTVVSMLLVGYGLIAAVGGSTDPLGPAVMMGIYGLAVPAFSGLGSRVGGTVALTTLVVGLVVGATAWGFSSLPDLGAPWCAGLTLGVLSSWHGDRLQRKDLGAQITLERDQQTLLQQMHTDALTGLPNRQFVLDWLVRAWESSRFSEELSVLVIDIDHFKKINDEFGHAVGDQVIRSVGRTLMRSGGPTDLVGRWGGEEFVMVLEGSTPSHMAQVAEALRVAVASVPTECDGTMVRATVSVGGAHWDGTESISPQELFVRADRALYVAKETGRNRAHFTAG